MEHGTHEFAYHGIGQNLLTFESIMQHGIVSGDYAARNGIDYTQRVKSFYDGLSFVSVALPHDTEGGNLKSDILNGGISFKTKPIDIEIPRFGSVSPDVGYIPDCISLNQIDGIIVNSSLRTKKISELEPIGHNSYASCPDIAFNIFSKLKGEVDFSSEQTANFQDLLDSYNASISVFDIDNCYKIKKQLNTFLSSAMERWYQQKLGKEDISVMDIVEHYNQEKFPIYDENDVKAQCVGKSVPEAFHKNSQKYSRRNGFKNTRTHGTHGEL